MSLEGWSHVPRGYGASFNLTDAPSWLRLWFNTPFIDRYAYPRVVAGGFATLHPHPGFPAAQRESVGPGWRVVDTDEPSGRQP